MLRKATVRRQGNPRGAGRTPTSFFPQQPTWLSRVRHKDEVCPCSVSCSGYRAPSCPPSLCGEHMDLALAGGAETLCCLCDGEGVSVLGPRKAVGIPPGTQNPILPVVAAGFAILLSVLKTLAELLIFL